MVLILLICLLLQAVDLLEIVQLISKWEKAIEIGEEQYERCLKWDFATRVCFSIFSLLSSVSGFFVVLIILFAAEQTENIFYSKYIELNKLVFGPFLLGFCTVGLLNWNEIMYVCDKTMLERNFSPSRFFTLVIGCIFGLTITLIAHTVSAYNFYLRRVFNDSNSVIGKLFWKIVFNLRSPEEVIAANSV